MEQEQTAKVTTPEPAAEAKPADQSASQSTPNGKSDQKPYKVYETQEEYDKSFKSEVSKAKNDWMKQVGVASVDEFKEKSAKADEAIKERDQLAKEKVDLTERLVVAELGVADDRKDDLLTLARAKATAGKSLKDAAAEVLEANPNWAKDRSRPADFGVGKSERPNTQQEDPLASRYPWLK
jgi:hypothetical protein